MSIVEGYLYARPLSEKDWRAMEYMIEPHFMGMIVNSISHLTSWPEMDGMNIANDAEFTQSDVYYSWREKEEPYDESGFLWDDRRHCRPPLLVAETADRIADSMEAGDEEVTWLIGVAEDRLRWEPGEAAADCIKAMRDLAKACRIVAEKGATEVTVFLAS